MKVVFLEHVLHVAKPWEVKEVASGYATNFLFPKKLAKPYSASLAAQDEKKIKKQEAERRMLLWSKADIIQKLSWEKMHVYLPEKNGKALGGITPKDIAEYIQKTYKLPLTKKHIDFWIPQRKLTKFGEYEVYVDLWENHAGKIFLNIQAK